MIFLALRALFGIMVMAWQLVSGMGINVGCNSTLHSVDSEPCRRSVFSQGIEVRGMTRHGILAMVEDLQTALI